MLASHPDFNDPNLEYRDDGAVRDLCMIGSGVDGLLDVISG